jgi:uncharacterized spore protein YtfJ
MRKTLVFLIGLLLIAGVPRTLRGNSDTIDPNASIRDAVEELKKVYTTEIILGKPLEVDDLKIIPLATVGIGYGQRMAPPGGDEMRGVGGVLSPVGVLVVSKRGVQLLPISKGALEQLLGAITPIILQAIKAQGKEKLEPVTGKREGLTMAEWLAALYAFLPQNGLKFGLFPWSLSWVIIFLVGWLTLALIITAFLPRQVASIASTLQENYIGAGLVGLLGYGVVFILAIIFILSIIGIPLTFVLLMLTWALTLFGTVSIAFLVGQKSTAIFRRTQYTDGVLVLVGGIILGIIRVIPVLGWIIWLIIGILGFGAILRTQRKEVRQEVQNS